MAKRVTLEVYDDDPIQVNVDGAEFKVRSAELRRVPEDEEDIYSPVIRSLSNYVEEWELVLRVRPSEQRISFRVDTDESLGNVHSE